MCGVCVLVRVCECVCACVRVCVYACVSKRVQTFLHCGARRFVVVSFHAGRLQTGILLCVLKLHSSFSPVSILCDEHCCFSVYFLYFRILVSAKKRDLASEL